MRVQTIVMKICLKSAARHDSQQKVISPAAARLPAWVESCSVMNCDYTVKSEGRLHLLRFSAHGTLVICCQRCLQCVDYQYSQTSELAVCANDSEAERLMGDYDCVLSVDGELDLVELLTDELVLHTPQIPHELSDCKLDLSRFN